LAKQSNKPVVLITGVSSGIGLATARLFAARGWAVVGTVRRPSQVGALKSQRFDVQPAEMTRSGDLERVIATIWRTYGRLDVLVCNAGYGLIGPIDSLDYAQMREQLAVNTLAPAELVRQVVPIMRRQRAGVIIGISSIVGLVGVPGYGLYAASKFALEGMFESLSLELATAGIRVKLIEPGPVDTAFWGRLKRGTGRKWNDEELGSHVGGRPGKSRRAITPEKVADVIYRATIDKKARLRYPVGLSRVAGMAKRLLPERIYRLAIRRAII
jgi:NAD(P)-dependent dehydrogenase (short-subunit alcohol dehydrogenase family)